MTYSSFSLLPLSFHCNDKSGHLRIGKYCFKWRNSFLLGSMYDGFGESQLILGARLFSFGQFRFF